MLNLLNIIFPPKCFHCQKEGSFICEICFKKIQLKQLQQCPICKLKINQGEVCEKCKNKSPLNGLIVATTYDNNPIIRKLVTQFKYKFNEDLAEKLGELLNCSALKRGLGGSSQNEYSQNTNPLHPLSKGKEKAIVPIPLHFRRKWQRGFNQAELLAKQVSKNSNLPICNLLKRIKNTPQQAKLSRQERLRNLKGAFEINEKKLSNLINSKQVQTPPNPLKGDFNELPTIILIDDIASTLTTLEESARTLKKAGFKNIWGLVIARG